MKSKSIQFNRLLESTQNHIDNKRYVLRPRKPKMVGNGRNKKVKKDAQGNIEYTRNGFYDPTPNKNILLSFAFNMALENYQKIRHPFTQVKKIKSISDLSNMLIRYFNNKYYKNIEDLTDDILIDSSQNLEYNSVNNFREIEYKLYGTVERLRNYHSHYLHEPGILSFTDLFETDKNLSQEEFDDAKTWFQKRFVDAHEHLVKSLLNRKDKLIELKELSDDKEQKVINKKIKQIDGVRKAFSRIEFVDGKYLTTEGQLFIACIFLYKRQAKVILDKWRGLKNIEGYQNTLHTFFTYYSLSERYSINAYNDDLLKFRDITAKLSVVPYSNNPSLKFIYDKIKELNEYNYSEIEKFPDNLGQQIIALKNKLERNIYYRNNERKLLNKEKQLADREALQRKIIPFRKAPVFTQILLQYILDNNLLKDEDNFKIAIKKTQTDRLVYLEANKELRIEESLTDLKNRIKNEENEELKHKLNEHLKELKRNFIFKSPKELIDLQKPREYEKDGKITIKEPQGFNFTIKKNNALFQYEYNDILTTITLSPDLLMKWVIVHLEKGENTVLSKIKQFVSERINKLLYTDVVDIYNYYKDIYPDISMKKILPKSIRQTASPVTKNLKATAKNHIQIRLEKLEDFIAENNQQYKSWKYASKRKIDTILQYIHFKLLYDVYINKINKGAEPEEDFIRHNSFNMDDYNIAREYFRFFGRYENNTIYRLEEKGQEYIMPNIILQLKDKYSLIFGYIDKEIKNSNSLEELFEKTINNQRKLLRYIEVNFDNYPLEELIKLFKIRNVSNKVNINSLLKTKYVKSFALSDDIISLKKIFKDEWAEFVEAKKEILRKKGRTGEFNYSEFAFLRDFLWKKDKPATNIDFILSKIIPKTNQKLTPTIFKRLLQLKTKELVMWNIAKHYWKRSNRSEYNLSKIATNQESDAFQEFCTFNKVHNQILEYKIKIDNDFWNKSRNKEKFKDVHNILPDDNKNISFIVKVPAKKYTNKFLTVETDLIKEYALWYHFDDNEMKVVLPKEYKHKDFKVKFDLNQYEDLMKIIYKELIQSITDIYQILRAEKKIIDSRRENYYKLLENKYENKNPIYDFYVSLTDKKDRIDKELFDDFTGRTNGGNKEIIEEYLTSFRNYALHYQLQDKDRKSIVLEFLNELNKELDKNEYYVEEK